MDVLAPPPEIPPVSPGVKRPFWSVMIPAYNPGPYLEAALRSVLDQAPGPDRMQIEVVDDASTQGDPQTLVSRLGGERVGFFRQPHNVGLSANWNTCVRRAHGECVHILHQDDLVLPGFYERLGAGLRQAPETGAAFCRFRYVDENGRDFWTAPAERETPGVLSGWLDSITAKCRVQCPAMVVRRATYEALGGFRGDLVYALDWEMWARIAARFPVWYEPQVLAAYRHHADSEAVRLEKAGLLIQDQRQAVSCFRAFLPADRAEELMRRGYAECARKALRMARKRIATGEWAAADHLLRQAVECAPVFATRRTALRLRAKMVLRRAWCAVRGGVPAAREQGPD